MRRRAWQASPVAEPPCPHGAAAVAQGAADAEVMVRRSRIAPCVTCGLCGGFLRDAAAIAECLHPFCRECIVEEFTVTDKTINRCPKCDIDLGCNPLKKLRADHSLQHIRSLIFPAKSKRRKMEEISPLQPSFVPLPSPSNQAHEVDHPANKADAHLMVEEPTNAETETEADERLWTEPSLEKFIASSPHTAVAPVAEPAWLNKCRNWQRDEQREEASSAFNVVEPQGAIQGYGIEEFESEHHGLLELDQQASPQERNELTDEVDPWTVAIERSKTRMTTQGWRTRRTTAEEQSTEGCRNELTNEVDPWTVAVEKSKTRMTTEGWRTRKTTAEERSTEGCRNELTNEVDPWTIAVERSKTRMTTEGWRTWRTTAKERSTEECRNELTNEVDPWRVAVERSKIRMTTEGWRTRRTTAEERSPEGCRNELTNEVDPWTVAVERSKTRMTTEGWRTRRTTAKERSTEGCRDELTNEVDPWRVAVERSKTRMTTEGWRTRRTTAEERSTEGCRNELTKEVDPWTVAVERSKIRMTTEGWRTRRTITKERSTEGCRNEPTNEMDPWTVAVERSKTRMTTDEGWVTDGWTAAVKEHVSSLTTQVEAERGRARSLEDEVRRLRRELEAARASASEADARRSVAEQKMMEAEQAAEIMAHAFNRARDSLKEYGLLPVDPPPDWSVAEFAAGFGDVVADCLDHRLRDAIADDRTVEDVRDATTVTAEYVLACCLSRARPLVVPHGDGAGGHRGGGRRGGGTRAPWSREGDDGVEACPGDGPSRHGATSWWRRRGRRRRECLMMDDGQAGGWPHEA